MTEIQTPTAATVVTAEPDSRLAQLHARYAVMKATADAAAKQLKDLTDAIKAELAAAAPEGVAKIALVGTENAPGLSLSYVESWRVDARKLKAEDPETYVRYAKKSGTWRLAPTQAVGGEPE